MRLEPKEGARSIILELRTRLSDIEASVVEVPGEARVRSRSDSPRSLACLASPRGRETPSARSSLLLIIVVSLARSASASCRTLSPPPHLTSYHNGSPSQAPYRTRAGAIHRKVPPRRWHDRGSRLGRFRYPRLGDSEQYQQPSPGRIGSLHQDREHNRFVQWVFSGPLQPNARRARW